MSSIKIYDAHSHIGNDLFHTHPGSAQEYEDNARRIGIVRSNIMPVPCPTLHTENGIEISLQWSVLKGNLQYHQVIKTKERTQRREDPKNPYARANELIGGLVKDFAEFIPLIHPTLDTEEHILNTLLKKPKAVKIHGVAAGIFPAQIPDWLFQHLSKSDTPIIVHTDCGREEGNAGIKMLQGRNSPTNWLREFEKWSVRGYITHGARISKEALEQIKRSGDQYLVGIGPDRLLNAEQERLERKGSYLDNLLELIDPSKLAFDLDYPWNVTTRNSTTLDWSLQERLKEIISQKEIEKVLWNNAEEFFK